MNKNIFLTLFLVILFPLNGCAGLKQGPEERAIRIKGKKEILVAKDVGRGAGVYTPRWCGNNALLFKGKNIGIELIDLVSKRRVQISSDPHDTPLNCTPDGKWVLYEDSKSMQEDPAYEYIEGELQGWMGNVVDLYRYEVETGTREKVASVRNELGYDALSPDGKKILLGARHSFSTEVAVPEWTGLWLTNEWIVEDAKWFPDSSGVALWGHNPNRICVEFFGEGGWAKCFLLGPEYRDNIHMLSIDRENRIYIQVREDPDPAADGRRSLYRCGIRDRKLSCKRMFVHDGFIRDIWFMPEEGTVFLDTYYVNCIRLFPPGRDARCVIGSRYGEVVYDSVGLDGISSDGRWLVFERSNEITKPDGEFSHWQYDLFVIDLANN
jgi:hypothetical protein